MALSFAAATALGAITSLVRGTPSAKAGGTPTVFRQTITDSFIVYGKRRVGGLLVFFHPRQVGKDHYRYFVIACAGHRCQGVTKWFLNDEQVTVDGSGAVTSGAYAGAAWLWFQRGLSSETANATFVSDCGGKWTTAHKGNGVAAMYAKFKMTDAVVQAGMPNITAEIEGRDEVPDPRDASTGYKNNAALVFYDWLAMPREEGGFGAYADELPDDDWISAQANVCDEVVSGEARYAVDAVITTGAPPNEIRDVLTVNCAGSLTYSGGKFLMRPGHYVPVTSTLSEDDLSGPLQVSAFLGGDQSANEVQGTYIDATAGYQGAPFATQSVTSDDVRQFDLDLAFVTSKARAERIARIMLNRAQAEKTAVWPMNIAGLGIRALDTVQLDTARYGLSNYAFQVTSWNISSDFGVVLSLREENAEIYDPPTTATPATVPTIAKASPITSATDTALIITNSGPSGLTVSATDAGSNASVSISAHSRIYADKTISLSAGTITGLAYSTAYALYYDDPGRTGAGVTYAATTTNVDAVNSAAHPDRHFLAFVTTPGAGGTSTSGEGSPAPGGGGGFRSGATVSY